MIYRRSRFLAAALLLAAAAAMPGCSSDPAKQPQTAQQAVYQAKVDYAAAIQVGAAYAQLPQCSSSSGPLCVNPDVMVKLQAADSAARSALDAAENTVRNPCPPGSPATCDPASKAQLASTAARNAVIALTAITATLQTKGAP